MNFTGKTVVITGGAQGIGRAVVQGVVDCGGKAIILDWNAEVAQKTVEEIGSEQVSFYQVDLFDRAQTQSVLDKVVADCGQFDVLINNAGFGTDTKFEDVTMEEWDKLVELDFTAYFIVSQFTYRKMMAWGGGNIVNVASITGKTGGGFRATTGYAAVKSGVIGLTKGIAYEGAKHNIRCNAVCPGCVVTPMHRETIASGMANDLITKIPMGRFGEPEEIANMILFFASDRASYVTGEIGDVDGGYFRD